MDTKRLYQILHNTTRQFRKGEVFEGAPALVEQAKSGADELEGGGILEIFAMPHESEAPATMALVDLELLTIGVDRDVANQKRSELIDILDGYPEPERLAQGPSYIEVGAVIGDQGAAFQLFALGKVLGLWNVITPKTLGAAGEEAKSLAGLGYIMISGYLPATNR